MTRLVVSSFVAAAVSLLATPLARCLARRWQAFDHGDGARKLQTGPVPYLGGIALFAALACGTLVGCQPALGDAFAMPFPLALLLSSGMICLVGWLDDRFQLRVRWKLLGQVLATLPLVLGGHVLERIECAGFVCEFGWWGVPLSIGWLVAGANALNFIDGADGLAATVGLVMAAATAIIAQQLGQTEAALLAAVLAAGLGGFLFYNWQPATIYLGDSGSMTVGLWLAAVAVAGSARPEAGNRLVALCGLFAVPLADLALAVARRQLSGLPFWIADRAHIHHRLFDRGFTAVQIAGMLAGLSAATGSVAFAAAVHGRELVAWSSLAVLGLGVIHLEVAGAHEFELARQSFARWLLDMLAVVSLGTRWRKCPQLERLSLSESWALFLTQMEPHQVERIEVLLAGRGTSTRHQWTPPIVAFGDATWCTIEIEYHGTSGERCRLRASMREGTTTSPLADVLLAHVMRVYAAHWAKHAEALSATLGHDRSCNLTTMPAVGDDLHRAA